MYSKSLFFVFLLIILLLPSISLADPVDSDARKITVDSSSGPATAKPLPADIKIPPAPKQAAPVVAPKPAAAAPVAQKPPVWAPKPAVAEVKQPAVEVKPNTDQTKTAAIAPPATPKEAEQSVPAIGSNEPSSFIKAEDSEVIEDNDEAVPAAGQNSSAVLSSQDPDVMKMNTEIGGHEPDREERPLLQRIGKKTFQPLA